MTASPDRAGLLREAAQRVDEAWDVKTNAYDLTTFVPRTSLQEMYERLRDLRRALAATGDSEGPLDVERLKVAIEHWWHTPINIDTRASIDCANWIAAEYARLHERETTPREGVPEGDLP